jgi:hypothetical protein
MDAMSVSDHVPRAYRAILWAGAVCAVLDGMSAVAVSAFFGTRPVQLFQGIASGLLGPASFTGGMTTAALGLAVHVFVAFAAAAVYYAASRMAPVLNEHAVVSGVVYGVGVHLFMTFVVIPLSAIGARPIVWPRFVAILIVHVIVVGPSISLTVRWHSAIDRRAARSTAPGAVRVRP